MCFMIKAPGVNVTSSVPGNPSKPYAYLAVRLQLHTQTLYMLDRDKI
jgi:hypothetical protein